MEVLSKLESRIGGCRGVCLIKRWGEVCLKQKEHYMQKRGGENVHGWGQFTYF